MSEAMMIDAVVVILLAATIYYAFRLDRRLQGMRNVQAELANVIRELNTAAARAEAGIQGLKAAANSTGQQLEEKIRNARIVGDELAILLKTSERSGRVAEAYRPSAPAQPVRPQTASRPALDALRAMNLAS